MVQLGSFMLTSYAGAEEDLLEGEASEWKKNHRTVAWLCLAPARVRKCTHKGTKHIHGTLKEYILLPIHINCR